MRDHALGYAAAGQDVLPLCWPTADGCGAGHRGCPGGKRPLTPHGKDDATTDPATITSWWDRWPAANIGLRPGEDVVVLDVDPRHGGAVALAGLLAEHRGELPETLTAATGGGGLHIFLRCSGPYRGQLVPGVDLKSRAGYVVAPPSLHESGRRYEWTNREGIAVAPRWLQALLRPAPAVRPSTAAGAREGGITGLVRVVAESPEGQRNARLFWAACRATEQGAPAVVLDQLREAARSVGLADTEISRTLRSALRAAKGAAA